MVLEIHMKLCVIGSDFPGKVFFYPQNWENERKMGQKQGLLKGLVINFYWIFSVLKIYVICSVLAEIPYL